MATRLTSSLLLVCLLALGLAMFGCASVPKHKEMVVPSSVSPLGVNQGTTDSPVWYLGVDYNSLDPVAVWVFPNGLISVDRW